MIKNKATINMKLKKIATNSSKISIKVVAM